MEWAELVLEYIKALIWPIVVLIVVVFFRTEIAAKIKNLKEASTPVGTAKFDVEAAKVEQQAETLADKAAEAKDQQEPVTEDDAEVDTENLAARAWLKRELLFKALDAAIRQLAEPPDFAKAEIVASHSPAAAVMLAYADLDAFARAAWTIDAMQPPKKESAARLIRGLTKTDDGYDFAEVAENLTRLRNEVSHGRESDVTTVGALNYIEACRRVAEVIVLRAQSKLRHPSRSVVLNDLADWMQKRGD